jgi:hypothetical protein
MKRYLIPIILLCFYACTDTQKKVSKQTTIQQPEQVDSLIKEEVVKKDIEEIKFTKINEEAVLIGEKIQLLDYDLKVIADISNLNGKIVKLKSVTDSLFNQGNDFEGFCKSFWYVEIQTDSIKGIVSGRQVFKIQNSSQDTSFTIGTNQIEILTTDFLGMGIDYEGDLMGCPVDQPILIKDRKNNYFGLVDLIQNEYSKKASWDNEYPFFEIRNDQGCYDKIESINEDGNGIRLKIHRSWQEGVNDFDVLLNFVGNKYKAEYLNFGERKYDD